MNNIENLQSELAAALRIWSEESDHFSRRCRAWIGTKDSPLFTLEQKKLFHAELRESERHIQSVRTRVISIELELQRARRALMRGEMTRVNDGDERQQIDLQPAARQGAL